MKKLINSYDIDVIKKIPEYAFKYPGAILYILEHYGVENLEIFTGFIKDEFKRLHPLRDIDETLYNVFEYNNMALTPDDFTPEQSQAFKQAVTEYKEANKKYIVIVGMPNSGKTTFNTISLSGIINLLLNTSTFNLLPLVSYTSTTV